MPTPAAWLDPEYQARLRRYSDPPRTEPDCYCQNCIDGVVFETGEDHYLALKAEPWKHPYETFDASMECRYCGMVGSYGHAEPLA